MNNKVALVAWREYVVRVRRRTFIVATLLTPIGIGLLALMAGYFSTKGAVSSKDILFVDESTIFRSADPTSETHVFRFSDKNISEERDNYLENHDVLVHIPPFENLGDKKHQVQYFSEEKLSVMTINKLERAIAKAFKNHKIKSSDIDMEMYNSFDTKVVFEDGEVLEKIAAGEEDASKSGKLNLIIGTILGATMGFLMYMVIFIYGGMVMRSVMEEKINRIVEVMISSVKPFQLMLGKILGVGAVGITQLAIWLILIPVILWIVQSTVGLNDASQAEQMAEIAQNMNGQTSLEGFDIGQIISEFQSLNWGLIIPLFVLFFFGGYFIYSSMFAAIGSAIGDDMGEGQQLMIPIVIPVVIAFVMLQGVLSNPNGSMAIFGSLFPLFSPIIMPARLAFDPPMWQIALSVVILILSCIFFVWFSGKIYRVGILLYGKKVSFKELGKWLFYKA